MWWPGIGKALEEKVFNCPICCQYCTTKTEPLIPSKLPDRPWQKVATDLFEWQKSPYLLVVDYYSRYIETIKLSSTTSTNIIGHLKSIFSRHGIPKTVMSDNGPQYSSEQFAEFASQYGFSHITSSPKYPQSNGEAERAVRTIKDILKRNKIQNGDMYMAMLAYRSTPLENGLSSAELLMGRKLRTTVPVIPQQLNPKLPNKSQLCLKENQQREKQRENFNKRHRAVISKPLVRGDSVWIPEMEKRGTVIKQKRTRSYLVQIDDGSVYQRNRKHLKWLPKCIDEDVPPSQPTPEMVSILPQSSPSDLTSMTYQTRSGRVIRAPTRYPDPGLT